MAESGTVGDFAQRTQAVLGWHKKKDSLIERDTWGDNDFKESESLIERILKMADDLSTVPVDLMDEGTLNQLNSHLQTVDAIFKRIDEFTTADMVNNRQGVSNEIREQHDSILNIYRTEVAWLAIYSAGCSIGYRVRGTSTTPPKRPARARNASSRPQPRRRGWRGSWPGRLGRRNSLPHLGTRQRPQSHRPRLGSGRLG